MPVWLNHSPRRCTDSVVEDCMDPDLIKKIQLQLITLSLIFQTGPAHSPDFHRPRADEPAVQGSRPGSTRRQGWRSLTSPRSSKMEQKEEEKQFAQ